MISIHALLAESDPIQTKQTEVYIIFLSTLSLRRATNIPNFFRKVKPNFYPRSPCGERQLTACQNGQLLDFYPRSPCGERRCLRCCAISCITISIHALLAESDGGSGVGSWPRGIFLSTLSLRRATKLRNPSRPGKINFYPRSPCGERLRKVPILGIK